MATLNDLNIKYVTSRPNKKIEGGAILHCSRSWTKEQLENWLPDFDFEMIEEVEIWLKSYTHILEEMSVKAWID